MDQAHFARQMINMLVSVVLQETWLPNQRGSVVFNTDFSQHTRDLIEVAFAEKLVQFWRRPKKIIGSR